MIGGLVLKPLSATEIFKSLDAIVLSNVLKVVSNKGMLLSVSACIL